MPLAQQPITALNSHFDSNSRFDNNSYFCPWCHPPSEHPPSSRQSRSSRARLRSSCLKRSEPALQPSCDLARLWPGQRPSAARGVRLGRRLAGAARLACFIAAPSTKGLVESGGLRDGASLHTLLPVRASAAISGPCLGARSAHVHQQHSRHRLNPRLPTGRSCWLCGTAQGVGGCLPAWIRTT